MARTDPAPGSTQDPTGVLVLAATPIGDADDASPALRRELAGAEIVAAEDTRRFRRLLDRTGMTTEAHVVSFFDQNEADRTPSLLRALADGQRVVVVSDAGMPTVSDPGYRLVAAAIADGHRVTAVPGPSAVLTALAVSGLPVDRFCFEGFLPRKGGERSRRLTELADETRTMVFFEAPHRTAATLAALGETFGPGRAAVVCRELTKVYEEVRRGHLADLAAWADGGIRGEVTLVVAGADPPAGDLPAAVAEVWRRVQDGQQMKVAVAEVADVTGLRKNAVYRAALDRTPS